MDEITLDVLVVEDNQSDAYLIKFYLEESIVPKFNIKHVENLAEAKRNLAQQRFDIILLDLNLPDSYGLITIKNLLEEFPNNLIIVLTGLTDEMVGLETVRYGAQDFLVKGRFDSKVLVAALNFSYERFRLNKELNRYVGLAEKWRIELNFILAQTGYNYFECSLETKNLIFDEINVLKHTHRNLKELVSTFLKDDEVNNFLNFIEGLSQPGEYSATFLSKNDVSIDFKVKVSGDLLSVLYR